MRIIQIIDSLDAGGAERMAVNYANALVGEIDFSGLVATRKEGLLLDQIHPSVSYLFLKKKKRIDINAILRLRTYVLKNKVTHIHSHSTSFFLAFLLKLTLPSLKIIRHDHYGNNEFLENRPHTVLRFTAFFFDGVITVNQKLKNWSEKVLKSKNVVYFPNFAALDLDVQENTILKGSQERRIVLLANLRPQKDHFLLLEVARKLKQSHREWSFHLVGKDFDDDYSKEIQANIKKYELEKQVFLYGSKKDVSNILHQAEIAILTSKSEGLPVALLEYGQNKKAVIVTNVGEVPFIIQNGINGFIVESSNVEAFYHAVVTFIENAELRITLGNNLFQTVTAKLSEKAVIKKYLNWLQTN
ncbi:glycosyltransferase family 4 protein [Flavobacterium sp. 17A]|uniref:Glycosyltransferase family 4 protein n=1 Tax=Flavobacterium potami TaxID=2872310 RepID=A0A9X1HDQ7_9FLAO|nr:glycosyltransferase family 4 protein [Flavobacterium potami]MBZ4036589.1 glycosyltransferase family 4 protein [Flavobacterium potami]